MPTSPSLRRSPAEEIAHKRGHSFGSTLLAKSRDDELKLFNDMQRSERENFLLEPSDNFGESLATLNYFPDFKLGANIAGRADSRDMLNTDCDKNDYDWLLTPPETPLFRSLDDEEDQRIGPATRGRTQTKPLSISRSLTMENTQRSTRSSASPSRLSPSPRSSSTAALARTRSLNSPSRYSPSLTRQPSQRSSSPPTVKTLTPPRRSPSPASRRTITCSSGPATNGTRGASPLKDTRGSSSQKLQGWLSKDPGFSFDAPPNLRTSLTDRPISRSRGGSPSSFSGLDMGSRGRRQSMSPTSSRRASSSHSNEQDRFSSFSKASGTSSGDDDLECVQSVPIGYAIASNRAVKKNLPVMKTRTVASPKKPPNSFSPVPAPKRSFDSAVWLMDHRKAPQDMFRPLLSSVPTTTLCAAKGNNVHRPMFSHNSSVTTSSNASSEHGATFGSCMDTNEGRHDLACELEATASSGIHDDIFMFDKLDEESSCHQHSLSPSRSGPEDSSSTREYVKSRRQKFDLEGSKHTSCDVASSSKDGNGNMISCTRCRKLFHAMKVDGGDYCKECALRDAVFAADPTILTVEEPHQHDHKIIYSESHIPSGVCLTAQDCVKDSIETSLDHRPATNEPPADYLQMLPTQSMEDTAEEMLLGQHPKNLAENISVHDIDHSLPGNSNGTSSHQCSASDCQSTSMTACDLFGDQNCNHDHEMPQSLSESHCQDNEFVCDIKTSDSNQLRSTGSPNLNVENTEGSGISALLLDKEGSNKSHVAGATPLKARNIICSEPYHTRDNVNMMKHNIERDSTSATSSVHLGSSRQSDVRFERHKIIKWDDFDKSQISSTVSYQSIASVSDMSNSSSSVSLCPQNDVDRDTSGNNSSRTIVSTGQRGSCKDVLSSALECWSVTQAIVNDAGEEVGDVIQNQKEGRMDHDYASSVNMCSSHSDMPSNILQSSDADGSCIKKSEDISAIPNYTIDSQEHPYDDSSFDDLQSEAVLASDELNRLDDCSVSAISEEDVLVSGTEAEITNLPNDEESRKQIRRCLTLEEATDTILLCNSIVQDLAYKAATIALEHEQEPQIASPPGLTVTIVGKSVQKEDGSLKLPHRRTLKPKVKRKRLESETIGETTESETITEDLAPVHSAAETTGVYASMKPPKVESKCNCTIM